MNTTKGLQFKKMDLHVHTSASTDHKDAKPPTAEDIVNRALEQGLAAIAITDHQTAASVDAVALAAKAKGLTVFPGVELMTSGGKSGVHINLLFDVDKSAEHINQFLNTVKVYSKNGSPDILTELTVGQVSDALMAYDPTAIIILAHCHSSKGVTGDISGEARTKIFEPNRRNILGAEARDTNFADADKKKNHTRVIDVFDGTDENYQKRKLGVFQASDAHTLAELGNIYSWFKVDEPVRIEDLRQCLIDRDTRIRQSFEFTATPYPRIESLAVTSGFLKGQTFDFHDGLNSLLGAKGAGKSLAIEVLRFVLDQSPTMSPINEDHWAKLERCLKPYGSATAIIVDESGKRYQITRTYKPSDSNPIEIVDTTDGSKKQFSIPELFPVLFLSQNEIIRVAEDHTGGSLRAFIDRFFDFHHYQHNIDGITRELQAVDRRVAEGLRAHLELTDASKKLGTIKEEIERLNRQLTNTTFEQFSKAEGVGRAIKMHSDFVTELAVDMVDTEQSYAGRQAPVAEADAEAGVKRAADASSKALQIVREHLQAARTFTKQKADIDTEYKLWEAQFEPIKAEYERLVKESGGNKGVLDQRRRKLLTEQATAERNIATLTAKSQGLKSATEDRNTVLDRLDAAYREYFNERSSRCKFFTEQSRGAIAVTIAAGRDVTQFKAKLVGIKKGSYVKDDDIDAIVQKVTPRELLSAALRFEFRGRQEKKSIEDLATGKALKADLLERLITHMLDEMRYEDLLALLYESAPQDVPAISYEVNGDMKPLADLSVGQKSAALLIVGLSDGRFPIVIDQPEDSLDLRSIWDDVCTKLRDSKERRQFIFTTHNSSVAVASDSDKFTILEAKANHAEIVYSGSLNSIRIRDEVIAYLEGGTPTYQKKREKYNL